MQLKLHFKKIFFIKEWETMFKNQKKFVASLALGGILTFGGGIFYQPTIFAANATSNFNESQIKWSMGSEGGIIGVGISQPDARGVAIAREAAIMSAQRSLVGTIQGVSIDSETTMRDLILQSDVVNRKITGVLKGAQIAEEKELPNGGYYVKMIVPLYGSGSVAEAVIPEIAFDIPEAFETVDDSDFEKGEFQTIKNARYTGIVIDCSGLGLEPTFSPVIYDANGRAVYGIKNLKAERVIAQGMVSYASSIQDKVSSARAGNKPLVIKAVEVRGGANSTNKVNAVVSVEDADKILLANQTSNVLEKCAVVFVR